MKTGCFLILLLSLSTTLVSFGQSAALDTFIAAYVKEKDFNATILIQRDSIIQYYNKFGMASRAFNVPNTTDTRYKIASITKLFTAVLILQLCDQGKLDLHKP